jgi:hypothetical protein
MAAGLTYEPIATYTLSNSQNDIIFSSIPSTYTDLIIVFNGKSTNAGTSTNGMRCRINSDSGANYSATYLTGNGSTASSSRDTSITYFECGEISQTDNTAPSQNIIHINNYANTNIYKTILCIANTATALTRTVVAQWRSTSAINSITLSRDFGTNQIKAGSTATLYGITKA